MTDVSATLSPTSIQEELECILASPFFRTSQRCSHMLRYIVEQFMLDPSAKLKERTIGIAVFKRSSDYDTANDAVVRSTAGEIRKRLAQYYAGQTASTVLIHLPAGSYFPDIRANQQENASSLSIKPELLGHETQTFAAPKNLLLRKAWVVLLAVSVGLTSFAVFRHFRVKPAERFWGPMRTSGLAPIICLGDVTRILVDEGGGSAVAEESKYGMTPNNRLALVDVVALNSFVSFLAPFTGKPEVRSAAATTFADLQQRPAILIGGRSDQWTMRAMKFLRFQLRDGQTPGVVEVVDTENPSSPLWEINSSPSLTDKIEKNYTILARFTDPETNRPTVIAAGVGPNGTVAGAECSTNPACLEQISNMAPHGWEKHNIEVVMETEVIDGSPGPSRILRVHVW